MTMNMKQATLAVVIANARHPRIIMMARNNRSLAIDLLKTRTLADIDDALHETPERTDRAAQAARVLDTMMGPAVKIELDARVALTIDQIIDALR